MKPRVRLIQRQARHAWARQGQFRNGGTGSDRMGRSGTGRQVED